MGILIDIKDMYKIYNPGENEVRALDGVSLKINHGEFVALLGHSGSGKSTFMNMLGCLDTPTSGSYEIEGEDISKLDDDELSDIRNKRIGFIFQGFNLIMSLTAIENVELPLIYRGISKDKRHKMALEALAKVGLAERIDHYPNQLSGGQQQRVAIARALAAKPPVVLADEPTGNLDSRSGIEVMTMLQELNQEGHTVILITHDNEMTIYANRIVRVKDGKIIEDYYKDEAALKKDAEAVQELKDNYMPETQKAEPEANLDEIATAAEESEPKPAAESKPPEKTEEITA